MPFRRLVLAALWLAVLALLPAPAHAAGRSVPAGWLGAVADGPLTGADAQSLDAEWSRMAASGVESVRTAFYWSEAQPYGSFDQVPAERRGAFHDEGGVPTDLSTFDAVVAAAARRHLGVLPIVHRTPGWAA